MHHSVNCIDCHTQAFEGDFGHADQSVSMDNVNCGLCHDDARDKYYRGIHGKAFIENQPYAPTCKECHGNHDILANSNPKSRTYKMNIPILCGGCHKEGGPVTRNYNVSEHNVLENYSQGNAVSSTSRS